MPATAKNIKLPDVSPANDDKTFTWQRFHAIQCISNERLALEEGLSETDFFTDILSPQAAQLGVSNASASWITMTQLKVCRSSDMDVPAANGEYQTFYAKQKAFCVTPNGVVCQIIPTSAWRWGITVFLQGYADGAVYDAVRFCTKGKPANVPLQGVNTGVLCESLRCDSPLNIASSRPSIRYLSTCR